MNIFEKQQGLLQIQVKTESERIDLDDLDTNNEDIEWPIRKTYVLTNNSNGRYQRKRKSKITWIQN